MGPTVMAWWATTAAADVCTAQAECFPSIGEAVSQLSDLELELTVTEGTYVEAPIVVASGRAVHLVAQGAVFVTSAADPIFQVRGELTLTGFTLAPVAGRSIDANDSRVALVGCTVLGTAFLDNGGSVRLRGGSLEVSQSTFLDGRAVGGGGQVDVQDAEVTVDRSTFTGGFARSGGALQLRGTTSGFITASRFEGNTAVDRGGSLFVTDSAVVLVSDSSFTAGRATDGGAVASTGTTTLVRDRFEGNEATEAGGAVFGESGGLSLVDADFVGNRAGSGGALAAEGAATDVTRGLFCENLAEEGGALLLGGGAAHRVGNARLIRNTADLGGAVRVTSGLVELVHDHLLANEATTGSVVAVDPSAEVSLMFDLLAFNTGSGPFSGPYVEQRNAFWSNAGLGLGLASEDLVTDPELWRWEPSAACDDLQDEHGFYGPLRDPFPGLPLVDSDRDLDGSAPDVGAYGGGEAPPAAWVDGDDDGVPALFDCDDANSGVYPTSSHANEIWYDDIDQDCDGKDNDADGDGVDYPLDCDDTDAEVFPGTLELPGRGDMDCDGRVDADQDGFEPSEDCDDANPAAHPGAPEDAGPADLDCDEIGDIPGPLIRAGCSHGGGVVPGAWLWWPFLGWHLRRRSGSVGGASSTGTPNNPRRRASRRVGAVGGRAASPVEGRRPFDGPNPHFSMRSRSVLPGLK